MSMYTELEELEGSLESIKSWDPQEDGQSLAGMVEIVAPTEKGYLIHLRDKEGQLWAIHGIARDIREFVRANGVEFGDLFGLKYLGANINQFGVKYRMFSCAVRKS